jgi:hypothetical protein
MLRRQYLPCVALLLGLLTGASAARADDSGAAVDASLCRSYPRRLEELEKWLKREMIPGQTTPDEVVAIFGRRYYHPSVGRVGQGLVNDPSAYGYPLDRLGIKAAPRDHAIVFRFDSRSGKLLQAACEYEERQTGFHIEQLSGP